MEVPNTKNTKNYQNDNSNGGDNTKNVQLPSSFFKNMVLLYSIFKK